MSIKRIITDIPPDQVDFVIAAINVDNGSIIKQSQDSGKTTIIVEFEELNLEPEFAAQDSSEPEWMIIAKQELGQMEVPGPESNPRIEEYHNTVTIKDNSDSVPWCSSFVNFCITKSGLVGTNSAMARSWLNWGQESSSFVPGCVVVLKRGDPPKGHVGFYVGMDGDNVRILGGNQSDSVNIASYKKNNVIAKRLPI